MKTQQTSESARRLEEMFAVSPYNQLALSDVGPIEDVKLFDTTLRDGEQAPGIALSPDDKVRIAQALDNLGTDIIEAGFAVSSEIEKETIRRIADLNLEARVCSLARCVKRDIDAVMDSGLDYVHAFIATSDLHMKYKLKMTPEEVRARAVETVEYAREHGLAVMFSCEDATRSRMDFMKEILLDVQDAGASSANIPDTVGVIIPRAYGAMIGELRETLKMPISVHCHNDMGLALANSLAAVENGATIVQGCVNGIGERTGNVALEEVAVNLFANYGVRTYDLSKISSSSALIERITGFSMAANKPIVGRNAFAHESGVHVHGIMNNTATYEPFLPEVVGAERRLVVGKLSGSHLVEEKLKELGIEFPQEHMGELMEAVKRASIGGKEVTDAEIGALADDIVWKKSTVRRECALEELTVTTGRSTTPTATVKIRRADGTEVTVADVGVGPVNAAVNAIRKAVNPSMTMEEYKLSAITGASDSLCRVAVTMKNVQNDGNLSFGRAVGMDIVETSVDATMAAINRDFARVIREDRRRGLITMGKTIAEKILSAHSRTDARAGQIVVADVDYVMVNDVTGPIAFRKYEEIGNGRMFKDRMVLIPDHYVPNKDVDSAVQAKEMRDFAGKHGLPNYFEVGKGGVCHQLMVEEGFAAPGRLIVGADSHTCTYGAVNALSTGIGSTEAGVVFATGKLWFRVPESIRIELTGEFRRHVGGKDLILKIISDIGVDGANYKALEFCGPGVANMPVPDRLTVSNMAIEAGGKAGIFPCDERTEDYIRGFVRGGYSPVEADPDARYCRTLKYDLSELDSVVAFPHLPSNGHKVKDVDVRIDQAYLGSCTNGRIEDMRAAAEIVRGRKVADGVRFIVVPASQRVHRQMADEGLMQVFLDAGAFVSGPTCGACLGGYMGILAAGERAVSSTNRNFIGRMGDKASEVYLASPEVVAASAIAGRIVTPAQLGVQR